VTLEGPRIGEERLPSSESGNANLLDLAKNCSSGLSGSQAKES